MQKYQNNVTSRTGDAVSGAAVAVRTLAGALATIYSDDGVTPTANPITSDNKGYFEFYAADGLYNIYINGVETYTDVQINDTLAGINGAVKVVDLAAPTGATLVGTTAGTVQSDINARPTTVALAAADGAATVGFGATTVAVALTEADSALHRSGGVNTPNSTFNLNINSMASDAAASSVGGGTLQQPNKVGWQVARLYTNPGTGSQSLFNLTAAFPITLVAGVEVVRVALIRRIDRVRIPQVVTTDYTIGGSGTTTIAVTFNSAVDLAVYDVWIRGIGSAQSGNAPLLNFVDHGYDSVTDGSGPQTVVLGAHHTDLGNAGGHNTFLGGSYNEAINNSNYTQIGGTNNTADALQQGGVFGANNIAGGGGTFVFGQRNHVTGDLSFASGDFHTSTLTGSAHFGRGSISRAAGHLVVGNYKSGDTAPGLRQHGWMGMSKTTTDATEGFLSSMSGVSLIVPDASTHVLVIANVIAVSSDGATCAEFTGRIILKRLSGTATLIGTTALTLGANTGALSAATMRFQAASNGLYIRPTGIAATTVRWMAQVTWVETSWAAA